MIPERVNIATEVLERQAAEHGGRTAFVWEAGETSYAGLRGRVARLAGALADAGVGRGTKVLVRMPNCIEFAVTFLALARIGAIRCWSTLCSVRRRSIMCSTTAERIRR